MSKPRPRHGLAYARHRATTWPPALRHGWLQGHDMVGPRPRHGPRARGLGTQAGQGVHLCTQPVFDSVHYF